MSHTPYGYRIENGKAVIDEVAANKVIRLYQCYLSGLSLSEAGKQVGINTYHGTVGRMLRNKRYLGDDYYPAIIDEETFERAEKERLKRAEALGRILETKQGETVTAPLKFRVLEATQEYVNPFKQAEYAYSLIESEVDTDAGE